MLKPSLEEVQALAKEYNTIPVFYTFCADHQTPMNIYRCMAEKGDNSFILESVSNGVRPRSAHRASRTDRCRRC